MILHLLQSIVGTVFSPLRFTIREVPDLESTMADAHMMIDDGRDDVVANIESMKKIEEPEALQSTTLNSVHIEYATWLHLNFALLLSHLHIYY